MQTNALLFHGIKAQYAIPALKSNCLKTHSFHRYWKDGRRLERGESGYEDHVWMGGICLSRDKQYAATRDVFVLEFSKDALRHRHKIIPLKWFQRRYEAEEFLQNQITTLSGDGAAIINYFDNNPGTITNLDKYLTGFYLVEKYKKYMADDDLEFALSHPHFKGYI